MKVLFLCIENSARSIMAEALLKHHSQGAIEVYSAGTSPSDVDKQTLATLQHFGLDTVGLHSKHLADVADMQFDYVITLCDEATRECDARINGLHCLAWNLPEPTSRQVADPFAKTLHELNELIITFIQTHNNHNPSTITPTSFYKALADDIRLKTLLIIAIEREVCVCELMEALNEHSQPKVSRHLAKLKKLGILADRKHQQWVFYSLNPTIPLWMRQAITTTVVNEPHFIEVELARLSAMGDRPTRVALCCN